ncbi:hypothetical protein EYR40_006036 [Pleurotus pulmonarius]|nr:hypothetical protein EYR36_005583 [Pleurotus pulmonarius]KAF4602819.1 hypothetical protein EYR40_006036 [Pleurotus pulmonarius]
MSLPTARKDISEQPAAGSVTAPIDRAAKDADVDRKIRLYHLVGALREGRMPTNEQIGQTLDYVLANSPVDLSKLSPEGRSLIEDTRDVINTAKIIVQEKNADELLQRFIWHTRSTTANTVLNKDPNQAAPVDKSKIDQDAQQATRHLRTLVSLVLTNAEVRKLFTDFSVIGRDLLAISASKASEQMRPSEDQLRGVDEPAPQDQFITEGGRVAGPNETPVLEARVPGTDHHVTQHPKDEFGTGATIKTESGDTVPASAAYDQARSEAEAAKQRGRETAQQRRQQVAGEYDDVRRAVDDDTRNPHAEVDEKKQTLGDRMRGYRDNIADRIPSQHKDRANEHADRTKKFLLEDYFPEERRDQFIYRGKKVVIECQKHDDYQESMRWLLGAIEEYVGHAKKVGVQGQESGKQLKQDTDLQTALSELRTLLERFANGKTMDGIFDAINVLIDDTRRDPELRDWFANVDTYIRKVLLDAGYVLEEECNQAANELKDKGRVFYDDKYKSHFDNLFDQFGRWFGAMGEDPLNKQLGDDVARLTKDLLFDDQGSLQFKPHLWRDIRNVIVPAFVDKAGYFPIPRIEYTDDNLDLVLENLALAGRNILPNVLEMEMRNYLKMSPYDAIQDNGRSELRLEGSQMQVDMRDVAFWYKKKGGMGPNMSDSGLADVLIGGKGLQVDIHIVTTDKRDKGRIIKVKDVNVKMDSLKFSIRGSKHDLLYKVFGSVATGLVKKQIQKAIADSIHTGVEYIDGQLVGVRDRMNEAKVSDDATRAQALKDLFKRSQDEASSLKSSDKRSQFKVMTDKKGSVIDPNAGHPDGWVNRTEIAPTRGREWRSDAFTLV